VAQISTNRTRFPKRVDWKILHHNWEFSVNTAAGNELTFSFAVQLATHLDARD
jgi:hypothetical protein